MEPAFDSSRLIAAIVGPLCTARYLWFTRASLPTYVAERGPCAKNGGSDLAEITDYIHANATPGDALYLQDIGSVTLRSRQALYPHPELLTNTEDVAFEQFFTAAGTFSDRTYPIDELAHQLRRTGSRRRLLLTTISSSAFLTLIS